MTLLTDAVTLGLTLNHTSHLWLYFVLVLGIIAVPGMEMAYILSSTLVGGRPAGVAAISGSVVGGFAHVAMSSLGIGLLLQHLPAAFNALLFAGALYVAWMGWQMWRSPGALGAVGGGGGGSGSNSGVSEARRPRQPVARVFARGLMTCLLNPKAYVFMLAVFPQFFRPEYGPLPFQAVILALITATTQIAIYGGVALTANAFNRWLAQSDANQKLLARGVGALLMATAVWTVFAAWSSQSGYVKIIANY